jgi:twitching motility protein PilT
MYNSDIDTKEEYMLENEDIAKKVSRLLFKMVKNGGSDLHFKTGSNIRARINGEIVPISNDKVTKREGILLAKALLRGRFEELVREKSVYFTYKLNEQLRFRVNIFFQMDGISAVFRIIPINIPSIESLNLPSVIKRFCSLKRGLVIVTGPTGSGKSTTLASIINEINLTQRKHIITIEDPIEFVYKDEKSIINQRSIGQDAKNFSTSLRAALREDPDVILVGEARDLETIETALHAAETGHLVFFTLHTISAKDTVSRVVGMFPSEMQNKIRLSLGAILQGVISQRLIPTVEGKRTAAVELLVKSARIESLIMEGRDDEINDALYEGKEVYGTQTFDQSLLDLYAKGIISEEDALNNATNENDLQIKIKQVHGLKNQERSGTVEKDIIALKR